MWCRMEPVPASQGVMGGLRQHALLKPHRAGVAHAAVRAEAGKLNGV